MFAGLGQKVPQDAQGKTATAISGDVPQGYGQIQFQVCIIKLLPSKLSTDSGAGHLSLSTK